MQLAILQKTNEMKPMTTEIPIPASRNRRQARFESETHDNDKND